ncbi:MAG: hypothetical protein ACP5N1_02135 [Candidatus Woesearchaeota archaeon]
MEKQLINALEKIIIAMQENNKLYDLGQRNYSRDKEKFTVLGLRDLANNNLFNEHANKLGISVHEGKLVELYFKNSIAEESINELYKLFPNAFQGESEKYLERDNINKNIPLFK